MGDRTTGPSSAEAAGFARHKRLRQGPISYISAGTGAPLVLLHGVGLNADIWSPQIEALSDRYHVIAIDMPGHGESDRLPGDAIDLDRYVEAVADFCRALGLKKAGLCGHSMGALISLGLGLRHPDMFGSILLLSAVYKREPDAARQVQARAASMTAASHAASLGSTLDRWYGDNPAFDAARRATEAMLACVDAQGYASAYSVFARADRHFADRLHALEMPVRCMTGEFDPNSTPAMSRAIADEAPLGSCDIVAGARHMLGVTHPDIVARALAELMAATLSIPSTSQEGRNAMTETQAAFDIKSLRRAMGSFMTGVTVVTTRSPSGELRGFTANSFTSVSLDPPLVLVCLANGADSFAAFNETGSFVVNIMNEDQRDLALRFASKLPDKFEGTRFGATPLGNPRFNDVLGSFECMVHDRIPAGDHMILVGRVVDFTTAASKPLGYFKGNFIGADLDVAAINVRAPQDAVIGCLATLGDQVMMVRPQGAAQWMLPLHTMQKTDGPDGPQLRLQRFFAGMSAQLSLGFLYAVFEHAADGQTYVIYRGTLAAAPTVDAVEGFEVRMFRHADIPWDDIDAALFRGLMQRYLRESDAAQYGVYSRFNGQSQVELLHANH